MCGFKADHFKLGNQQGHSSLGDTNSPLSSHLKTRFGQIILLIFIVFYLTLCLLSWENSILSWVSCKPPQNTKKREGPAFVLKRLCFPVWCRRCKAFINSYRLLSLFSWASSERLFEMHSRTGRVHSAAFCTKQRTAENTHFYPTCTQ